MRKSSNSEAEDLPFLSGLWICNRSLELPVM